jgi:hypothetical protein
MQSVHNLCYTKGAVRLLQKKYHSHLFITSRHIRKGAVLSPPCILHLFIISMLHEGCRSVPPCYHSHLFITWLLMKVAVPTPKVSFASVHKFVTRKGAVPSSVLHHSHLFINLRYTKGCRSVPPCHSHLFINLCYTKGCRSVPPCYHSHLFIICVTRSGAVPLPPCYHSHLFINLMLHERVPFRPS